ncbi:HTH-type transcriptional repressor YvoA [Corynebacterium atrinae]|uniref:GntR family transcriptional regulator n=1 Tax=Corynebacterium atrinae TaxID=1336740 RepID=UPI0025B43CCC|nr:GntR family transcriptional regulator [Corynebacterium atrinae]WJY64057.1 HTH-type transcriptional repressor YvoA [Corynebacterium atrinae]
MNIPSKRPPAYVMIADQLRGRIERGELLPGDRLPAERELVDEFGVARMTVRHALDILQLEGLIDRRRGRTGGTFVRGIPPVLDLTCIDGLMPQLRERGLTVTSTILEATEESASPAVACSLDLEVGEPVFRVSRLRHVDGTPMFIEISYFPAALVPGLLEEDLSESLYALLRNKWNLHPARKSETINPGIASGWEQDKLRISRNLPLLRISRVAETADGVKIEFSEDALRSDVTQIRVITDTTAASD